MPFCQTAPPRPSHATHPSCPPQQQHVMEYWGEGSTSTAVPPVSTTDIVGQHIKIRGVTFGAAFLQFKHLYFLNFMKKKKELLALVKERL